MHARLLKKSNPASEHYCSTQFNLGNAIVLGPLQEQLKGKPVIAICIQDDSLHLGEPDRDLVCAMMTRTMDSELGRTGRENLALKYGEAKKQLYQAERSGDHWQASIDSDVDVIRLRHEGTQILPAGVNRNCLKFAGIFTMGDPGKVSVALERAVAGPRSKLTNRMVPFLNSPLVNLQPENKLCILHHDAAAGERSLALRLFQVGHLGLQRAEQGASSNLKGIRAS